MGVNHKRGGNKRPPLEGQPRKVTAFSIDADLLARLDGYAQAAGVSRSEAFNLALAAFLARSEGTVTDALLLLEQVTAILNRLKDATPAATTEPAQATPEQYTASGITWTKVDGWKGERQGSVWHSPGFAPPGFALTIQNKSGVASMELRQNRPKAKVLTDWSDSTKSFEAFESLALDKASKWVAEHKPVNSLAELFERDPEGMIEAAAVLDLATKNKKIKSKE